MHKSQHSQVGDKQTWSLHQWLIHLESVHTKNIDMGLDRVQQVLSALDLSFKDKTVVTVAGTNGKGTTCAMIERAGLMLEKRVGVYSSPHILDYRERVRINNTMLTQETHCAAFLAIEQARRDITLTYFEFGTLAGLYLLANADIDIALLEVGLGGRLDAVNIVDPDIAVITGIDLDHQEWLGNTRTEIAVEKAGIFRPGIPAVIGDPEPPQSLCRCATESNVKAHWQGQTFGYVSHDSHWEWYSNNQVMDHLPLPRIPMQNASTALAVIEQLGFRMSEEQVKTLITETQLPGRLQTLCSAPRVLLDVAHNPQATRYLYNNIQSKPYKEVRLVVAMLADKEIEKCLEPFKSLGAQWYLASLDVARGAKSDALKSVLVGQQIVLESESVLDAYNQALLESNEQDLIVVFGSFFTVATVLQGVG